MLKAMSKFQGVLKMFMLGMLKTILKTVLKYKKNTITLQGLSVLFACVGSGDPVRVLRLYTTNTLDIL